jgi:hypothetical protein
MKLTVDPIFEPPAYDAISAKIDTKTTVKSNWFHLSLKYSLIPRPVNFIASSIMKIEEKM